MNNVVRKISRVSAIVTIFIFMSIIFVGCKEAETVEPKTMNSYEKAVYYAKLAEKAGQITLSNNYANLSIAYSNLYEIEMKNNDTK